MSKLSQIYTLTLGEQKYTVELNNWAQQTDGSVIVKIGDTVVLATVVMSEQPREGGDFFPLTVEYEEKFYAAGKILGSRFVKRETRPSEEAILSARLIDRSIRPLFNQGLRNEVQVITTVLSIDNENDPDIAALLGASLALSISPIPWGGPIAGVRVAKVNGSYILNPTYEQREKAEFEVLISGVENKINMLEAEAREISEKDFAEAVEWGAQFLPQLIKFQQNIISTYGPPKREITCVRVPSELQELIEKEFRSRIEKALFSLADPSQPEIDNKQKAYELKSKLYQEWLEKAERDYPNLSVQQMQLAFEKEVDFLLHQRILEKGERPDGRKYNQLRELYAAAGVLPRVHGSGLFMRGETHVLSILTLGAPGDQLIVEGMEIQTKKNFLHHYNFPPYSTGEVKPIRGPGRREIGHGVLAGKALKPLIPSKESFPYTIRIVSEVLSSNGSSSMASVCGSSLALMDAGVPIERAVAGVAMGLVIDDKGNYKVLTDIQGPEDHYGDMDFKVAGTRKGITAVQMDVKIEGITIQILKDALEQAKEARFKILDVMEKEISAPRPNLSPFAPRISSLKISPDKIGTLIGPGGKVINEIIEKTGVEIDIEDDGTVFITSENQTGSEKAQQLIKQITREFRAGEVLKGKVTRILDFGAMVEVGPHQEGLVHISELAPWHVNSVTDIVKVGDEIPVVVRNTDEQGRLNLSLKDVPGRYTKEEIELARKQKHYSPTHPRGQRNQYPNRTRRNRY